MMEIYYMDGGPFETGGVNSGKGIKVLGYDPGTSTFLALRLTGETFWGTAANFDPPPPIPAAAARKPQVGEVWIADKYGACLILDYSSLSDCWQASKVPGRGVAWLSRQQLTRLATLEEAEPFRPILEGLKRSLGEA